MSLLLSGKVCRGGIQRHFFRQKGAGNLPDSAKWKEFPHKARILFVIETGEYELDPDDLAASLRAYCKKPDVSRYSMRVGHETVGTL